MMLNMRVFLSFSLAKIKNIDELIQCTSVIKILLSLKWQSWKMFARSLARASAEQERGMCLAGQGKQLIREAVCSATRTPQTEEEGKLSLGTVPYQALDSPTFSTATTHQGELRKSEHMDAKGSSREIQLVGGWASGRSLFSSLLMQWNWGGRANCLSLDKYHTASEQISQLHGDLFLNPSYPRDITIEFKIVYAFPVILLENVFSRTATFLKSLYWNEAKISMA